MTSTIQQNSNLPVEHIELLEKAITYAAFPLSPNTLRSYKSMFKKFQAWCEEREQSFLPTSAETIALYLSSLGESVSFSTLDSTIAAIEATHERAREIITGDHSLYRRVRKWIRRAQKGHQAVKRAPAITILDLKQVCRSFKRDLRDDRDRALLTLMFFGAFSRSEAVSLDIKHLEFNERGMAVSLLQSKTSATNRKVDLAYAKDKEICPIIAVKEWIEKARLKEGALFLSLLKGGKLSSRLSGHAVCKIIKEHFGEEYSGHSARRGSVTASAAMGATMTGAHSHFVELPS